MRNWIMKQIRQLIDGALSSLFPRFFYKIYLIVGIFSAFLFLIFLKELIKPF